MMEHRRSWTVDVDGRPRRIDVVYRALFGWMSIEVDGQRHARAWREIQTVLGGATLSCELDGHRLDARITQPWNRQEYAIALRLDGEVLPGSDSQPESRALRRRTIFEIVGLALTIAAGLFVFQLLRSL